MAGLTERLSRLIVERRLEDFPEGTIAKALKVITDTFAVILSGVGSEVEEPLLAYLDHSDEQGITPILGTGRTASASMSAIINGTFGQALYFDDVLSMMPALMA